MKKQMSDLKFTVYILGFALAMCLMARYILGIPFFDPYKSIKPGEQLLCTYNEGCQIIDKPQPFTGYRDGLSIGE